MSTILKQAQPTFGELAGNGRIYEVPKFQRDYSWDKEEWEDLWLDLKALEKEGDHYMGYVVLQETNSPKKFIIIDGQQRLATISILILAAVKLLIDREDTGRAEDLKSTYLSSKDIVTRTDVPKLKLNYNDEYIYGGKLMQLDVPANLAGTKPSGKKLVQAFNYFYNKLATEFSEKSTEEITAFITLRIDVRLFFTSITVQDDINAFKVFETLNARGVKLSTGDLLKNYLFSIIYSPTAGSLSHEEKKWYRINDILGKTDVTTYLRHFWNARNFPGERKATLFKTIKATIQQPSDAIRLLNDLDNNVSVYAALSSPQDDIWTTEQSKMIEELNTLDVSQCFSLLMMAHNVFSPIEFNKALRDIIVLSFRYNTIGGQNPNELERIYGKASAAVFRREITTARSLYTDYLKDIYINDDSFKNDFKNKSINTRKYNGLVKYILAKLEMRYEGNEPELYAKTLSIEHILPEHPDEEWSRRFDVTDIDSFIYRIGNLTLLETTKNREIDRKSFEEKSAKYETSNYKITRKVSEYNDWTPSNLVTRQKELAQKAATIWKIQY